MFSFSFLSIALSCLTAAVAGLWLSTRIHQRTFLERQVELNAASSAFLIILASMNGSFQRERIAELELLSILLSATLFVQVARAAESVLPRFWSKRPSYTMIKMWLVPAILVMLGILYPATNNPIGLQGTGVHLIFSGLALFAALGYLWFRSAMTLPAIPPSDLYKLLPWVLWTTTTLVLMLAALYWPFSPIATAAHYAMIPSLILQAKAADAAVEFKLTVERAGTDSVVALREALFLVTLDERIDYANPAAQKLVGKNPQGSQFRKICPDGIEQTQTTIIDHNNNSIPVLLSIAPLIRNGKKNGYAISATDITDLKHAVEEAQAARIKANKAAQARQEFVAVMSHEIRTPLNAVLGLSHLLQKTSLAPEQKDWVDVICRSSDALLTILNDVLDFSRIESGRLQIESLSIDPSVEINSAIRLVEELAKQKGLCLNSEQINLPEQVITDPTRLRQIILNLLSNAIKFTEAGSVSVTSHYKDEEEMLVVKVTDTGIGIPKDRLKVLFDAFEQADISTTRRFGGVGLGLAISLRLARLMGGDLTAESEEGSGSCFTLIIKAEVSTTPSIEISVDEDEQFEGINLLVVDDNSINQEVIRAILNSMGVEPDIASNGEEGVSLAIQGNYDAVLMDLQMPIKDGWQAMKEIRDTMGDERPFLVSHSAGVAPGEQSRAIECGANTHLPKPVRPQNVRMLLRKIVAHLEEKSQARENEPPRT